MSRENVLKNQSGYVGLGQTFFKETLIEKLV